jgi:hypothetical protein
MSEIQIQQGDSLTLSIVVPLEKMAQLQDFCLYSDSLPLATYSKNQFLETETENIFLLKLSSEKTMRMNGKQKISMAFDFSDLGVKKSNNIFYLSILNTQNKFSNNSTSNLIQAILTYDIIEDEIIEDVLLAQIAKGEKGEKGDKGDQGIQGLKGDKGDKGDTGNQGVAGINGTNGANGLSAYEIAVQEGYVGTQSQWNNDNNNRTFINTLILG